MLFLPSFKDQFMASLSLLPNLTLALMKTTFTSNKTLHSSCNVGIFKKANPNWEEVDYIDVMCKIFG